MDSLISQLREKVRAAGEARQPLRFRAGGTKDFYGQELTGEIVDVKALHGIVDYAPTELVITARAGTPLAEVERVLSAQNQMLPFEPPYFGEGATVGGCVAAGLSGPRRASAGSLRDFVLGVRLIDGRGNELRFGGQVMKNVAGYDVSRLMTGSLGTLGLLLEVSFKVLPVPPRELTLRLEKPAAEAIKMMNEWAGKPLPVSATCHYDRQLTVRLSGSAAAVRAAHAKIGGEQVVESNAFWRDLREHRSAFFRHSEPLWRISFKPTTPPLTLPGQELIEWGGALRWFATDADANAVRDAARSAGGHATLFRGGDKAVGVFQSLAPALEKLHRNLKQALDPAGILNQRRLYQWM